jgi:hypothetical protein
MVKTADLRNGDHLAAAWRLDGARVLAVFGKRQMGPRAVVVIEIREQDAAQVAFVDHDHMIQTLAANRADDSLNVSILPGRPRGRNDLRDPVPAENLMRGKGTERP